MVFIKILTISGKIYYNHTGQFPVISSRGGKYIMFVADYDSDAILADPLTSRNDTELLLSVTKLYDHLKESGLQPHLNTIHNECSALKKKSRRELGATYQLVTPGLHRSLIAEGTIKKFKAHLIAGL